MSIQAVMVDAEHHSIEALEISSKDDIARLVGQDTIILDKIDGKNAVYFDEDCFIRGSAGRFQLDTLAPISGKAVIVGWLAGDQLTNVTLTLDELGERIKFL